ncbi:hypothetical protein LXL04_001321 [Taraxacum kok-saghyz]
MDFQKKRIQFLSFIVGVIVLSFAAEKCRQMVGETGSSQSGKFTIFNCLDGGSGTVACLVKEGVKLYTYNIRTRHVEVARNKAIETSLADSITQGMDPLAAAKQAQKDGAKAAKMATRKAKRIIGPIISSGWDFFEAIYYGGTVTEGFLRGTGTLFGTYYIGYLGEERFGRFGYLVGSQLGSWIGGRIGLMVYDIGNGVHFLLGYGGPEEYVGQEVENGGQREEVDQVVGQLKEVVGELEENVVEKGYLDTIMDYVGSYLYGSSTGLDSEMSEEAAYESFESSEEL